MKKKLRVGYFILAIVSVVVVKTTFAAKEPPPNLCERWISLSTCTLVGTSGPGTYYGCLTSTAEWCSN